MTAVAGQGSSVGTMAAFVRPIAHRGWHDAAGGVIENSLPAFARAMAGGYGAECDLRPSRDGTPVVFHDAHLGRLTTASGPVSAYTAAELGRMELTGSADHATIPTFAELLALVDGRVPILAEVKSEWSLVDPVAMAALTAVLRGYRGPIVLMSFDPDVLDALAGLAPDIPRGLVSGSFRAPDGSGWWPGLLDDERRRKLENLADFERTAASLIAYEGAALPCQRVSALRSQGTPVLAWTIRTQAQWDHAARFADAPIFEGQCPSDEATGSAAPGPR